MKITITCSLIALSLFACQKSKVTPLLEHSPITAHTLQKSVNGALTDSQQFDIDLSGSQSTQFTTCSGEVLEIVSGLEHFDIHRTFNKNNLSLTQHVNTQSLKLVSLTTGAEYTGSGTDNISQSIPLINGPAVVTETESIVLTTSGGKNNPVLKFDLHETIDPAGNITALADNFRTDCR